MKVITRAGSLIEKFKKLTEDETPAGEITPDQTPDLPDDKDAVVVADQPTDVNPEAKPLQEADLVQPEGIANGLQTMENMCNRYMDEGDADCFTPADDEQKTAITEARYHLREGRARMLKLKK